MADIITENISGEKQVTTRITEINIDTSNPLNYKSCAEFKTNTTYPDGVSMDSTQLTRKDITLEGELVSNEEVTLASGKTINVAELMEAIPLIVRQWAI